MTTMQSVARESQTIQNLAQPQWRALFDTIIETARRAPDPMVKVHTRTGTSALDARQVDRFFADHKYVCFYYNGAEQLTEKSLLCLQQQLQHFGFMRIRRNALINTYRVANVRKRGRTIEIELQSGERVMVSRRLCGDVLNRLAHHAANKRGSAIGLYAANMSQ